MQRTVDSSGFYLNQQGVASFRYFLNGSFHESIIGTFQSVESSREEAGALSTAPIIPPGEVPEGVCSLYAGTRFLDMGGVGDCFFMCLNTYLERLKASQPSTKIYSIDSVYKALGIPLNTFIEETHIAKIASLYDCTIYVGAVHQGELVIQGYGTANYNAVAIFNRWPHHYYLASKCRVQGNTVGYNAAPAPQHVKLSERPEAAIVKSDYEDVEVQFNEDPSSCEVEAVEVQTLYQYVDTRYSIKKSGKQLTGMDSKMYFKLRHNCFKTCFLDLLNIPVVEEKTFKEVLNIDSNRTPDVLIKNGDSVCLIEFTVVRKFETSVRTKVSRGKYDREVLQLRELKYKVTAFYPTLALDTDVEGACYDLSLVSKELDLRPVHEARTAFEQLQSSILDLESDMSELVPELLTNSDLSTDVPMRNLEKLDVPEFFSMSEKMVGVKRNRQQKIFALIRRNSRNLESFLRRVNYKAEFKVFVNLRTNTAYIDSKRGGATKNLMLTLVQNLSRNILDYTELVGGASTTDEPFRLYGKPKMVGSFERKDIVEKELDTEQYESYYYSKLVKESRINKSIITLAESETGSQVLKVEAQYLSRIKELRSSPNTITYAKNYFIFPCCTDLEKGAYKRIPIRTGLTITDIVLSRITEVRVTDKIIERDVNLETLDKALAAHNKAFYALRAAVGNIKLVRRLKTTVSEQLQRKILFEEQVDLTPESWDLLRDLNAARRAITKGIDEKTRTKYSNRVSVTPSIYKKHWQDEMEHFMQPKGVVKQSPEFDMTDLNMKFASLFDLMWSEKPEPTTDDLRSNTDPVGMHLKTMLEEMSDLVRDTTDSLKKTQIMHDLEFISRMCYSLLYLSNIKLNKEDFMYDNMGYSDALLLVKGGKKILSTKKTRLFKLIFPLTPGSEWLYCSKYTQLIVEQGKTYAIFPWQTFHFDMAKLGTELYYSFSNYYICSHIESDLQEDIYKKFVFTKVLNMYSQRRKVEIWFGFFRYLYLNSLSSHTSVLDLISDMADYDYDPYFYYCQRKFASGYSKIYENAKQLKIHDIFTDTLVENFDLCAEKFDESLFMTRAPVDRVNEHLKNMRSVLSIQHEFNSQYSSSPKVLLGQTSHLVAEDNYFEKLFSDDLKFDPKLCVCVGKYAGQYLSRLVNKADMSQEFTKLMSNTYTKISTGKGMRSSEGYFWGAKGHEVIFEQAGKVDIAKEFVSDLPKDYNDFKDRVSRNHISFRDLITEVENFQIEFDMKDKKQWKGSREIYVMSEKTKLLQSPLESFFKYLCVWTPNELIHKKSHVRPKFIHSQVFEFSETESVRTFCTLDCRKWAPKSNLWKYYFFIKGMSPYLPDEFVEYFNSVWSLMFKKKVRFQKYYIDILKANKSTAHLVEKIIEREDGDYEILMPYSFMMGIFNYLSSLLHAFSQLYFNDKVAQRQEAMLNLVAHSDDSGGVILSSSYDKNVRIYRQYEMFQKGLNHLMSKKKCSLSPNFFELISIMYAGERLIPMTHKFLANVSFEPKGKGWVDDISSVVSKVVELSTNGASHLQCYLTMTTMCEMIRKFYHIPRIRTLSRIPLAFGGVFNMHPMHLILLGADAQEVMLDVLETPQARSFRINCYGLLASEYFPGKGATVNYHIPYYKSHKHSTLFESEEMKDLKTIASCLPNTTLGDTLAHYSKIKDPAYVYSLEGVDMCQIHVMTLFTKTMVMMASGEKSTDLTRFCKVYGLMTEIGIYCNTIEKDYSQFHNYMKSAEGVKMSMKDMTLRSKKTCKPISYNTFESLGLNLDFKTICEIIAYNQGDRYKFMFPDESRMESLTFWVKNNLRLKNNDEVVNYLMKLTSKDTQKLRSAYSFMPSGISLDTLERYWTYSIFYTTRRYYISTQKPQYFTLDQFKLWSGNYVSLKHYYLLLKLAFQVSGEAHLKALRKNCDCPTCENKSLFEEMFDEVMRLRETPNWSTVYTTLTFATYEEAQRQSMNVWYGGSQFTLYSPYGSVRQYKKDGETYYEIQVNEEESLDRVYFLLKNFISTRGIMESTPIYSVNEGSDYKLGFNDLNKPIAVSPGAKGIIMRSSIVRIGGYRMPALQKEDSETKFTLNGSRVDFEIYYNYDLNPKFYDDHNLTDIRDMVFGDVCYVEKETVLSSILSSKAYKVLMEDATHQGFSDFDKAYESSGVLGDERSLTRALVLSNTKGVTKYTSSADIGHSERAIFESVSYKEIPVIDLIDNFSFARVTFKERSVIQRLVEDKELRESDVPVIDRVVAKIGAKPTLSAITTLKVTFAYLSYMDVSKIAADVVEDFLYTLTKAAVNSISDRPRMKGEMQAMGNLATICNTLAFLLLTKARAETLAEYMSLMFLRAHYDNTAFFWDRRKTNIYCALYQPSEKLLNAQYLFILACINKLRVNDLGFKKMLNIRQIIISKKQIKDYVDEIIEFVEDYDEAEYITGVIRTTDMEERNYYLDGDDQIEDGLDAVSGGDDPEEFTERTWEGEDSKTFYLISDSHWSDVAEMTLKEDYSELTLYTQAREVNFPWLGAHDREVVIKQGVLWYKFEYPGHSIKQRTPERAPTVKIERIESKPVAVLKDAVKNTVSRGERESIFKLASDEDVFEYQRQLLIQLGYTDVEKYSKLFFKYSDTLAEESFWKHLMDFTVSKVKVKAKDFSRRKVRSNLVPGFTGNLQDPQLRAELDAMFNNHCEEIVSGNQVISVASRNFIMRNLKRMYRRADESMSGLIILLLATLKDAIVVEGSSDSWYTDSMMAIMDWIEDHTDVPETLYKKAPAAKESVLVYKKSYPKGYE
jgi:hypothetical protein